MLPTFLPKFNVVPAGCEDKNRYSNVIPGIDTWLKC